VIRLIIRCSGVASWKMGGAGPVKKKAPPRGPFYLRCCRISTCHYVADLWFSRQVSRQSRGEAYYFRFADDVVGLLSVQRTMQSVSTRSEGAARKGCLELAEEKTAAMNSDDLLGRMRTGEAEKPKEFTFLDYALLREDQRRVFKVKTSTSRKRLGAKPWANQGLGKEGQTCY